MEFTIPEDEMLVTAVRAGGPGGQHVNKTSTKIQVLWDVEGTKSLSRVEKDRLRTKLANRMDGAGVLRVTASEGRSQLRNKETAVQRINDLVRQALIVPKPRKKTKTPKRAHQTRLSDKKKRSQTKQHRKPADLDE